MKFFFITLFALFSLTLHAEKEFVNLTPRPKTISHYDGRLDLPKNFDFAVFPDADAATILEAQRFVDILNRSMTGHSVRLLTNGERALFNIVPFTGNANTIGNEGYRLTIKPDSVGISAQTSTGLFYALQSVCKMLAPNVSLGLPGDEGFSYFLPIVTIVDQPRFSYRSFMLDCSRHFFSVAEIKRMLDVMAIYKLNTFHWHLTDDQGWRAEIKKYPRLTQEGATRSKNWSTPIHQVDNYWWTGEGTWDNHTYGPYFYSQDEMRDIAAYAAERHIEIIPEIEMPGHAVAAMVAYPEYSCTPNAKREVWTNGGISNDVMNVANPATMQFLYDIIDEICDIFPGRYFHIGGDECPTDAWSKNAECQSFKKEHNLSNDREIQSYFINKISEYLATKGKRTIVWNESITADKTNLDLVTAHNPVIMCWYPCQGGAAKAASLGLDAIITEYHGNADGASGTGGYYINRRQSNDYGEPTGAGAGDDTVEGCYNYIPVPSGVTSANANHYIGVQGTFWCEHVDSDEYLEYLALPRLIAMAETGWSTQGKKNWKNFVERMVRDTELLDLGNYVYARHWMPNYEHRVYQNPITDGAILQFTNQSADRGRCLRDNDGILFGQGDQCTDFILEATNIEGQYNIRSAESGLYLYTSSLTSASTVTLSEKKTAWTFDETTMPGYVAICAAKASDLALNNNCTNTTKVRLYAHGTSNGASFWKVESMGNTPVRPVIVTPSISSSDIYDIQGRRLHSGSTQKGIYIINGKKMVR